MDWKKGHCIKISQYFPKPFRSFGGNVNVKFDLSDYATKTDFKNVTHVDTLSFALKTNLANVVKNKVVKKTVYDKLVAKLSNIHTSGFVLKTKNDADKTELEKKIHDTSKLVKKSDYNANVGEIEGKIPSISGLITISALNAAETKFLVFVI